MEELNDELDNTRGALDREIADNTRSKRLQESEDRLSAIRAAVDEKMTANVEVAMANLADKRMELDEVRKKLVSTTDELSDLIGKQEIVNADKRAAVLEETELIAAYQRIEELETNASRVVPPAPMIERRANSPTETPHIPRGTGSGMDELLRGDTTSSSTLPA